MSRDIKDLLGAAIGDEPPLGIDRDAVFEDGRKRLWRRRAWQSGAVAAAVVVAAVGAATLAINPARGVRRRAGERRCVAVAGTHGRPRRPRCW